MNSQPEIPQTVSILCRTCGSLLHPDVTEQTRKVRCHDCFVAVPVPSLAEVLKQQVRTRPRKTENVGTYRVLSDDTGDSGEPAPKIAPYVKVICRICSARLHPEVREKAYQLRCPDCHEPVDVPALKDVPQESRRKRAPRQIGSYKKDEAIVRPKLQTSYLEVQAEIRREAIDPPPRWTFFSGVFTFPWRPGVLQRWGFLSLGFTILGLLFVLLIMLIGGGSSFGVVGAAFFGLPAIWAAFWTCSYAAACCLPVTTDTAAGMDRIANWPDPVWNEWMAQLLYVGFVGCEALTIGFGVGRIAELFGGPIWVAGTATTILLYPIFQLSSLEANSFLIPITRPILRSLVSFWWGWLIFYGLSGMLVFAWIGLAIAGAKSSPVLVAFVLGPMVAAILLIIARLLGRLAWRASLLASDEADESKH
jgi:DNA-directed RNA polymerase subunit M/transcription elongation factor TFIIS